MIDIARRYGLEPYSTSRTLNEIWDNINDDITVQTSNYPIGYDPGIFLPGRYETSAPLICNKPIRFIGSGQYTSQIHVNHSGDGIRFENGSGPSVENLTIWKSSPSNNGGRALAFVSDLTSDARPHSIKIENVTVTAQVGCHWSTCIVADANSVPANTIHGIRRGSIRNVECFSGAWWGILLNNCVAFKLDNVGCWNTAQHLELNRGGWLQISGWPSYNSNYRSNGIRLDAVDGTDLVINGAEKIFSDSSVFGNVWLGDDVYNSSIKGMFDSTQNGSLSNNCQIVNSSQYVVGTQQATQIHINDQYYSHILQVIQ